MKKVLLGLTLALCLSTASFAQQIPRPAGSWSAKTVDNKVLSLDQYKGKYVLLAFLLTTCSHCQAFTGVLNQIQREFVPQGVAIVGSTISPLGTVGHADFVQRFGPQFPIGAMEQDVMNNFGQWGPRRTFVPQVFLIDKAGMVQAQFMGGDPLFEGDTAANVRAALLKLMGKSAVTKNAAAKK